MSAAPQSSKKRTSPRQPVKRPRRRLAPRRRSLSWRVRGILACILLVVALFAWAILARHFAPRSNTSLTRFDAIIVLGTPADNDGNPSPRGLARVTEAVHEYERGVAPRLIFTGAAVANRFIEAQVMAHAAEAQGIPESAVFVEPQARDTIQNVCFSERIMARHGWHSAEVISNDWHLGRAAIILGRTHPGHMSLEWSTHAAPSFERETESHAAFMNAEEIVKTVRYLVWARQTEKCEP